MATAIFRPGDRPLLHLGLFGLTAVTTLLGYITSFGGWLPFYGIPFPTEALPQALQFSASILLILGSHEMGHYVAARRHGVDTTLPYFIPTPPGISIGTIGAVIRIRGPIPNLNALVDIGASGPLVGLVVAIPILLLGLTQATVIDSPQVAASSFPGEYSLVGVAQNLWEYFTARAAGQAPEVSQVGGTIFHEGLLLKGLSWAVFGALPEGKDLAVGPLWIAGWFGVLVTMLNLFPIGQLDGGHVTHALFGRHAVWIGKAVAVGLAILTLFWSAGWLIWLLVTTKFIGFRHPEVMDTSVPLTSSRKVIALLCLLAFVLCVVPIPLSIQRL